MNKSIIVIILLWIVVFRVSCVKAIVGEDNDDCEDDDKISFDIPKWNVEESVASSSQKRGQKRDRDDNVSQSASKVRRRCGGKRRMVIDHAAIDDTMEQEGTILMFPIELIFHVMQFLSNKDLVNMRMVSKMLNVLGRQYLLAERYNPRWFDIVSQVFEKRKILPTLNAKTYFYQCVRESDVFHVEHFKRKHMVEVVYKWYHDGYDIQDYVPYRHPSMSTPHLPVYVKLWGHLYVNKPVRPFGATYSVIEITYIPNVKDYTNTCIANMATSKNVCDEHVKHKCNSCVRYYNAVDGYATSAFCRDCGRKRIGNRGWALNLPHLRD